MIFPLFDASTVNVRMSEGTFSRVEVHIIVRCKGSLRKFAHAIYREFFQKQKLNISFEKF